MPSEERCFHTTLLSNIEMIDSKNNNQKYKLSEIIFYHTIYIKKHLHNHNFALYFIVKLLL